MSTESAVSISNTLTPAGIASRPKPVAAPRQKFNMASTSKPPVGTTQKASGAVVTIPRAAPNDLPGESRPAETVCAYVDESTTGSCCTTVCCYVLHKGTLVDNRCNYSLP